MDKTTCTINLDCPPGATRPDDILIYAIKDTGLDVIDFTVTSKLFGNWSFELTDVSKKKIYKDNIATIEKNIILLYKNGSIRYGSW